MSTLTSSQRRHVQVLRWRGSRSPQPRPIMMGFGIWEMLSGVWSLIEWILPQVVARPAGAGVGTQLQLAMTRTDSLDLRLSAATSQMSLGIVALALGLLWPRIFAAVETGLEGLRRAYPKVFPSRRPSRRGRWFAQRAVYLVAVIPLFPMLAWLGGAASSPHIAALWPFQAKSSLVMGGCFLIAFSLTLRFGTGRRCGRCDYRMVSFRQSVDVCPECGNAWKRLGGTDFGRRPPRVLITVGILFIVAAAMIWAFAPIG